MDIKDKKILVTGGAGFLGKFVVQELIKNGASESQITIPRVADIDLRVWENCQKVVQGMDLVIHMAAKVGGIGFNRDKPGELFYDNAIMGIQMIEAARQAGVGKFVALGTICAYPKFTPVPFREDDIWNGYPEETNASYGLAKKMMLVQGQAYRQQYGMDVVTVFPVNLYGPGDNFDPIASHVIPALIRKIAEAKAQNASSITAWGTGSPTREFLYVEDGARGVVMAAMNYDKPEPVNIGSGMEISIKALTELIAELMDYKGSILWDATKPDGQPRRSLDVTRAEKEFGFRAQTDFRAGLQKTIQYYYDAIQGK
jgi:GDP-L-fucose synthase